MRLHNPLPLSLIILQPIIPTETLSESTLLNIDDLDLAINELQPLVHKVWGYCQPNHKPRRIAPRIARAYRKTGYRKPGFLNRKWHPKTCKVPRKARLHRLQKILVDATEERPSIIRGHRRRNSY